MSRPTYQKAAAVVQAAEQAPEKFGDIAEEMDRTGKVGPAYREMQERLHPAEYPNSDLVARWISVIHGRESEIRHRPGGLTALLAERDKWDRGKVETFIVPML